MLDFKPEVGSIEQEKNVSITKFLRIMQALDAYNDSHGIGALLANFVLRDQKSKLNRLEGEAKQQQLESAVFEEQPTAKTMGLVLDFNEKKDVVVFDADRISSHPKDLRLTIEKAPLFLKFLKQINKDDFSQIPELKEKLSATIDILINQMIEYYDPISEDPRGMALLENASLFISEFERLGLGSYTGRLEEYFVNRKRQTLNEFISLNKAQCFDEPGKEGFGPSKWHLDTSVEDYKKRWKKNSVAILGSLQNIRAMPMVKKAMTNLIACAEYAIKEMQVYLAEQKADENEYYFSVFPQLIKIAKQQKDGYEQMLGRIAHEGQARMN
ncbi:MAG: hypothetical protein ABH832_03840 [bacterium]